MFLALSKRIPILQTAVFYPLESHLIAIKKFGLLWLASLLPLFLAALFSKATTKANLIEVFFVNLASAFQGTDPFIYAVSFITPIFLLSYERNKSYKDHVFSGKRSTKYIKKEPTGLTTLVYLSAVIMLFTALSYAHSKTASFRSYPTIFESFFSYSSIWVYLYALFCWYLVVLDGCEATTNYTKSFRENENQVKAQFKKRISKGNNKE